MSRRFRRQSFNAVKFSLSELLDEGGYVIPPYQRPYRWSAAQVGLLVSDLLDFFAQADAGETYSLGTIVCDLKNGTYEILDGQQRLTTIDLILQKVEEKLNDKAARLPKRPQLIAAYRYLPGNATAKRTALPHARAQQAEIERLLGEIRLSDLASLRDNILYRVVVRRVVIPLSGRVDNEAQHMFEIINVRGQKLTALDIVKSRLLSTLDNEPPQARALFDYFWTHAADALRRQDPAAFIPKKKTLAALKESNGRSLARTIGEILAPDFDETAAGMPAEPVESAEDEGTGDLQPPVNLANAIVIAHELFRHWSRAGDPGALTEQGLQNRFDNFVRGDEGDSNPVACHTWQLLGILRVVLQTAAQWGPYRNVSEETVSFSGSERIGNAALTFMAANGYQPFGQYWLLLLSAVALINVAPDLKALPTDDASFLKFPTPAFKAIEAEAYRGLLYLGYLAAESSFTGASASIFFYLSLQEEARRAAFEALCTESAAWPESWSYNDGLSQWDLYWVDYLLSLDAERNFEVLRSIAGDESVEPSLKEALAAFDWEKFVSRKDSLRMVSRSSVEHWLAQDKAEGDEAELCRRHGFGNLALIDRPSNSSLGKQGVTDKSDEVMKMPNPAWKLWWLAVFSSHFSSGEFTSKLVAPLSHFWGLYLQKFFNDGRCT